MAHSLESLGMLAWTEGDYTAARPALEESLRISEALDDRLGTARALQSLGWVALAERDATMAASLLDVSLVDFRQLGVRWRIAWSLCARAQVACRQGDHPVARILSEEALIAANAVGDRLCVEPPGGACACRGRGRPGRAGRATVRSSGSCAYIAGAGWPAFVEADFDDAIARAGSQLDESTFAAAWSTGCATNPEDAVRASRVPLPEPSRTSAAVLTARETEVLRLVAADLTDVQVAGRSSSVPDDPLAPAFPSQARRKLAPSRYALAIEPGLPSAREATPPFG